MKNKFSFRDPEKIISLTQMRERLVNVLLLISFIIGTLLFGIALVPAIQLKLTIPIWIYSVVYLWMILITFVHRIPYGVRVLSWLAFFYLLGIVNLGMNGFNVDAGLFLLSLIAMAAILDGLRGGLLALGVSAITISIAGFFMVGHPGKLIMGLPQSNPMLWIIGGMIFLLMGILLAITLTVIIRGLASNMTKATELAEELTRTNQSLRQSEERYRTLVETSPGLVALLGLDGSLLMINRPGLNLFQYESAEDVVGKNILDFVTPEERQRIEEIFQRSAETGDIKSVECLALKKDGTFFYAEFNASFVFDQNGSKQAIICTGRDISDRKQFEKQLLESKEFLAEKVQEKTVQLQETTNRFVELVAHSPVVIYSTVASEERDVTYVSENVETLLGYTAADFLADHQFWKDRIHPEDMERILSEEKLAFGQERCVYEYRFLHKNGSFRWLRDERMLVKDASGNPQEYVGSWSDINDRKLALDKQELFEASYRRLYESMMDAYVAVDINGRIVQFNQAFLRMMGYYPDELYLLTYNDLIPEKWHSFEEMIENTQILMRGYSDVYEIEYRKKDGTVIPVELRTKLTRDIEGTPSGMWAIVRNISERKLADEVIQAAERRYHTLLDHSLAGVIVFQDMRIVYANPAIEEMIGYTINDLRSLTPEAITRLAHPEDQQMMRERFQARFSDQATPGRDSLRIFHRNGDVHWLDANSSKITYDGRPAIQATMVDLTNYRLAEIALRQSEETNRVIMNSIDASIIQIDSNGTILAVNDTAVERIGKEKSELLGANLYDVYPEVSTSRRINVDKVFQTGKAVAFEDERQGMWIENSIYPVLDEQGSVSRAVIFARDVTDRKHAEIALRESEERYRTLAEASPDMIFIIGDNDKIQYVNSFAATYLGKPREKIIGQKREYFFPAPIGEQQSNSIRMVTQTGKTIYAENKYQFRENIAWLSTWLVPLKDSSGKVTSVLGVSRDITDRKRSEEALLQSRNELEDRVAERTAELLANQQQLRALTSQMITAQEEERRHISRELHDEAGQALITLKYSLSSIESELSDSHAVAKKRLAESVKIIDQTVDRIRMLAHSLRPPVLEVGGINLSLKDYCDEFTERTRLPVHYQGQDIPLLPDEIGISLFRFAQESLTNILKHAHATEVNVDLKYRNKQINLSVADNGRGIDDQGGTDGIGLLGIKERLKLLGGNLQIQSRKGRGVKLVAHVPWCYPEEN